jgi:hypothetical protein
MAPTTPDRFSQESLRYICFTNSPASPSVILLYTVCFPNSCLGLNRSSVCVLPRTSLRWKNLLFLSSVAEPHHFYAIFKGLSLLTVLKDPTNFVTNNYGAGRLFSVTKFFVIDSWRLAALVISNEIYISFGSVLIPSYTVF